MNKFYEGDLIKDLKIDVDESGEDSFIFEVENSDVNVLLVHGQKDTYNIVCLMNFYNYSDIKGKARCTLYFMLKEMIKRDYINENTKIDIPMIEPNTKKNAEMYSKMGFNIILFKNGLYIGEKPNQTIGQLIKNLEIWCNNDEPQRKKKREETKFDKQKYNYNGRNYNVNIGPPRR
jgi:hypothetical protein